MIYDKKIATHLIGCLIKHPSLLVDTDKYKLEKSDFDHPIHKIIFSTIYNLFQNGAEKITITELHSYLRKYPELYTRFNEEKGSDFILAAEELGEVKNFPIYYDRIKKLALLRELKSQGFDIGDWFAEGSYDIVARQVLEKKLEEATLEQILVSIQGKLFEIESEFVNKRNFHYGEVEEDIEELVESFKLQPEIGMRLQGDIFTSINRGARKGKLYYLSGASGQGKSRLAVGNAAYLAYPVRWCRRKNDWQQEGSCQKVLFITTELSFDEIQTMVLANITGINEEKILNGDYTKSEQKRIDQGIQIMRYYKHNFHLYHMPDPNIQQLNANIKRLVVNKQIQHVFYDYVHTSPSLLAEFSTARIREDVALSLLSTALKNIANELQVFVFTGTQLNAHAMDADFIDEGGIRGARSIIEKADFASAMKIPTKDQLKLVEGVIKKYGNVRPNLYIDIFKNRRGKHKRVRLWSEVDLGCCRITDLFLTDEHNEPIEVNFLYTKDENAQCDITAILSSTTETPAQAPPKQTSLSNITL